MKTMKILILLLAAMLTFSPVYGAQRGSVRSHTDAARRAIRVTHHVQYGTASWYGWRDRGKLMASGEPFNEHLMIAAHRTLPLGTRVRVTNLRNGRSVVVKIMDRGPWIAGRVIDLSRAAALRLGFTHRGLARVRIRVLSTPQSGTRRSAESIARNGR